MILQKVDNFFSKLNIVSNAYDLNQKNSILCSTTIINQLKKLAIN